MRQQETAPPQILRPTRRTVMVSCMHQVRGALIFARQLSCQQWPCILHMRKEWQHLISCCQHCATADGAATYQGVDRPQAVAYAVLALLHIALAAVTTLAPGWSLRALFGFPATTATSLQLINAGAYLWLFAACLVCLKVCEATVTSPHVLLICTAIHVAHVHSSVKGFRPATSCVAP